jgi:hypothetical protein
VVVTGAERERLCAQHAAENPACATTFRVAPVIALHRVEQSTVGAAGSARPDRVESENRDSTGQRLDFFRGAMADQTGAFQERDADRYFGGKGAQHRAGFLGLELNQLYPL